MKIKKFSSIYEKKVIFAQKIEYERKYRISKEV